MNILITGGLGYVGGRLTEYFGKRSNTKVYALTRGKSLNEHFGNIEVIGNDELLKKEKLRNVPIDVVIHLAAMNEHACVQFPFEAVDVNIKGTIEWLMWARRREVGQFIFFSTAHVYGKPLIGNFNERSKTLPSHPYSITHDSAEKYVLYYFREYGLNTKIIRLSNSFGYPAYPTADRWTLLINDFCRNIVTDKQLKINSNRLQERDFISLGNVCTAIEKLIAHQVPEADNRIFNLCSAKSESLFSMGLWIKKIAENYFQEDIEFIYDSAKDDPMPALNLSNEKLKKINWFPSPEHDNHEIEKTFDFFIRDNALKNNSFPS